MSRSFERNQWNHQTYPAVDVRPVLEYECLTWQTSTSQDFKPL